MKYVFVKRIFRYASAVLLCTVAFFCGVFYASAGDSLCEGHNVVSFTGQEPTCFYPGYTPGRYCFDCQLWVSGHEEIPPEHKGEERKGTEPTCTEKGYEDGIYCTVCENWISGHGELPVSHKTVTVKATEPTCTADGYTEGSYCTECETWISGHEIIYAGHNEVFVSETPATCSGNGYTSGFYCTRCFVYVSGHIVIPFKDHTFTEKIIDSKHLVSEATASSPAVYRYDCLACAAMSSNLTFTHGDRLPPGITAKIVSSQSTSAIKLSWAKAEGADGYRIYYFKKNVGWKAVKQTTETSVTFTELPAATKFTFAVRALSVENGKLILSASYKTFETATATEAPAKITSKQNASTIRLAWTAVRKADGYRIYYKSSGKWKVCVSSTTQLNHTFSNLPSGQSYTFAVRPYIKTVDGAAFGEYRTFTTSTLPAAPKIAAASYSKGNVTVAWAAVNGADGYQLFYKKSNGSYKLYKAYTSPQKLTFTSLSSSTNYTFAVRALKKTDSGYVAGSHSAITVTIR